MNEKRCFVLLWFWTTPGGLRKHHGIQDQPLLIKSKEGPLSTYSILCLDPEVMVFCCCLFFLVLLPEKWKQILRRFGDYWILTYAAISDTPPLQ